MKTAFIDEAPRRVVTKVKHVPFAWFSFALIAAWVFGPVVAKLVVDWSRNADYSHGLICAPLAIAFAVRARHELAELPRAPRAAGFLGAMVAIGLLLLGSIGAELFLTRIALLLFIASAVVFLYGWRHLRTLAFPFGLLLLSVPVPAIVMTRLTLPLQFTASAFAEAALDGLHIPVLREGNVLVLSNATLQVAEACSGIRSLMSLVALGLVIAKFTERRAAARALIVASAVPVAIVVNTLRVTATAIGTSYYGPAAAEGAVHEAVGAVMFLIALALVFACARAVAAVRLPPGLELAS